MCGITKKEQESPVKWHIYELLPVVLTKLGLWNVAPPLSGILF